MLRKNGVYVSNTDLVVQDMYWYVQIFSFSEHGLRHCEVEVKKGIVDLEFARSRLKSFPLRNAWLVGPIIEFDLNYYSTLWSSWRGEVQGNGARIIFTINNPDYNDIAGEYNFVPDGVVHYSQD